LVKFSVIKNANYLGATPPMAGSGSPLYSEASSPCRCDPWRRGQQENPARKLFGSNYWFRNFI